jgi:hypothetical protein
MLREAAAQGRRAYFEIYESHKSWDRGDPTRCHGAAGEPDRSAWPPNSVTLFPQMLAIRRPRHHQKRDPVAARYWAARARKSRQGIGPGRSPGFPGCCWQNRTSRIARRGSDTRAIGPGYYQYGARTALAKAIRKQDPVRARKLLEEARSPDPGGATPLLAEMLIAGEGGPADPQRALKLLKAPRDSVGVKGAQAAISKASCRAMSRRAADRHGRPGPRRAPAGAAVARGQSRGAGAHPSRCTTMRPRGLDEPGAMAALIELKLSAIPSSRTGQSL